MNPEEIASRAAAEASAILGDLAAVPPKFSGTTRKILKSLAARLRVLASSNDLSASKEILYLLGSSASITPDAAEKAILDDLRASPPSFSELTESILESIVARLIFLSQNKDERASKVILYLLDSRDALKPDFDEAVEIEEKEHPSSGGGMSGPK